jgi:glutathione gamma-glutamylcysteinyltransferase
MADGEAIRQSAASPVLEQSEQLPSQLQQQQHRSDCSIRPLHDVPLPPALAEPQYSVRRRVLPESLYPLNSTAGRRYLLQALQENTAASYLPLVEHFTNQSDPAFCGVTTLLIVLNALSVDPGVRWKGGWRYFGSEDVLLSQCCLRPERIRRVGISMDEFSQLAACQGLRVTMKRVVDRKGEYILDDENDIEGFRRDVLSLLKEWTMTDKDDNNSLENAGSRTASNHPKGIVVVSFSRSALGQTGDGHFSPIAAYHEGTDQVLVLDVARFKYQPYWVTVPDLFRSMLPLDTATKKSRGWYLLNSPAVSASYKGPAIQSEDRRPAELVPQLGQPSLCPVHPIKLDYCKAAARVPSSSKE